MCTFLVLDAPCPETERATDSVVIFWNSDASGSATGVDLAEAVARQVVPLREELNAWTVDTGAVKVLGRSVEDWFCGGEALSMWWCATLTEKHPKITLRIFDVLKARILEKLADERGATELVLVSGDAALAETLRDFCAATGRTFRLVEQKAEKSEPKTFSKEWLRSRYYALSARTKALVRFPLWLWQTRRRLPYTSTPRPVNEKQLSLVTYFPNIDLNKARDGRYRSRYWENLHDLLSEKGQAPVNWLFLFFPSDQCDLRHALTMRDAFAAKKTDGLTFHFLEEFLDWAAIGRALKRFRLITHVCDKIEADVRSRFVFSGSKLPFWALLKENWNDSFRGWRCLERCLHHEAFKGYAAWCGKQESTVFVQENCPWERMLCQAMHDAGNTRIFGMQHSTVRPTDFRYFEDPRQFTMPSLARALPDLWLNNGTGAREALVAAGMPETRSVLVEALRYQYLAAKKSEAAAPQGEASRRLLVCTSFFADETDAHLRTLASAYKAGALEGFEVCVKAHPYLPVEQRLAKLFPEGGAPALVNRPIGELLVPGVTVWASNSTTVALEAVYRRLAVLVQAPYNDLNLSPVQDIAGVPFVRTAADVAEALASVRPADLPPDYLCLNPELPRWRAVLEEKAQAAQQ